MMLFSTTADEKAFGAEFLDEIANWIAAEFKPEDIFDEVDLEDWAKENGWTEEV